MIGRARALPVLQRQRPGTFAALVAATCLLMLLAVALVLALHAASAGIAEATAGRLLVQIVDADAERRDSTADRVLIRLDHVPGLISAHRVPESETQALITPYIQGMNAADIPMPAMIELTASNRDAVARALRDLPGIVLSGTGDELAPLAQLVQALRAVAFGVALVAAAATGLIAMLAARAVLAREAGTLAILHALGATDGQLSRLVTGRIARDAGIGAGAGLIAALLVILALSSRLAAIAGGFHIPFGPGAWSTLLALPLLLVGLTVAAAQASLLSTLQRAP